MALVPLIKACQAANRTLIMKYGMNYPKMKWLLILIIAALIFTWIQQQNNFSEALYYNTYGDSLSIETIDNMISVAKKYSWSVYLVTPVMLLLRICFTSLLFYIALYFRDIKSNFGSCFNIAIKADTAFLFVGLLNIIYFTFVPIETLADIMTPFSLAYFIDMTSIPPYIIYPLGLINLGEIIYWILLVIMVRYQYKMSISDSLWFIVSSYGVGLLLLSLTIALIVI